MNSLLFFRQHTQAGPVLSQLWNVNAEMPDCNSSILIVEWLVGIVQSFSFSH